MPHSRLWEIQAVPLSPTFSGRKGFHSFLGQRSVGIQFWVRRCCERSGPSAALFPEESGGVSLLTEQLQFTVFSGSHDTSLPKCNDNLLHVSMGHLENSYWRKDHASCFPSFIPGQTRPIPALVLSLLTEVGLCQMHLPFLPTQEL